MCSVAPLVIGIRRERADRYPTDGRGQISARVQPLVGAREDSDPTSKFVALAHDSSGVARDDGTGGNIARHHRPCSDQ